MADTLGNFVQLKDYKKVYCIYWRQTYTKI